MDSSENTEDKDPKHRLKWTDQVENILIGWADKAIVYKWFHQNSCKRYKKLNYGFTIPCVILSTILASATFALSGDSKMITAEHMIYAQYGLGGVNILIGILQTLQNFFKFAQNSEAHDSVSKQWYKFYRIINTELNLARNKRRDADEFMKYARNEFDRLIELSPSISTKLIEEFKKKFNNIADLELPDICDVIQHTKSYRLEDVEEEDENNAVDSILKNINNNIMTANMIMGQKRLNPLNMSGDSSPNAIERTNSQDLVDSQSVNHFDETPVVKNEIREELRLDIPQFNLQFFGNTQQ